MVPLMAAPRVKDRGFSGSLAGGFTLVEVMMAVLVLGLVVSSCLVTLRVVFSQIEAVRNNTLASQILQSEMENLRLRSWTFIKSLENGDFEMDEEFANTPAKGFQRRRYVFDVNEGLREMTLEVQWTALNGTTSTRRYSTYFARNGLNDYYYRAF
jgi:prepilin-type N-terminal cleavage/methylation domain-containing protein